MVKILFVCTTNGARSQIAEGLAQGILKGIAKVKSAGFSQTSHLSRSLIHVMKEIDIDVEKQYVKSIEEIDLGQVDLLINLCSKNPIVPCSKTVKTLNWNYDDPLKRTFSASEQMGALRKLRDDLQIRISLLKSSLVKGEVSAT